MRPSALLLGLAISSAQAAAASSDEHDKHIPTSGARDPCTVMSTTSGTFYDLSQLAILPEEEGKKPAHPQPHRKAKGSWHARGYDYPSNFTMNICAPVIEELDHVQGVDRDLWRNVSAYYEVDGKTYSIGQESANLTLRGPRIVLQYQNGSPCGSSRRRSSSDNDDDEDNDDDSYSSDSQRRKSSTISFHCERDSSTSQATFSFVGTDPAECNYMFEVRSPFACGGSLTAGKQGGVGPGAVFAIIGLIAILVYFLGGVFYQRNVAHARGWRQLPNYSMWAGIGRFLKDIFTIATASCARCLPSPRGYRALSVSSGGPNGRSRGSEDENRLIDQLDEEWND